MNSREVILDRVREALRTKAPQPGAHFDHRDQTGTGHRVHAASGSVSQWLPAVGVSLEEWISAFATVSAALRTEFHLLNSAEETTAKLRSIAEAEHWQRIASHQAPLTKSACAVLKLPTLWTDGGYDKRELEQCDAGITECDALIAQTGSVLITGRSAGGRALSVLPPHHVVLARRDHMLPDLPAAFALLRKKYAPDYPSFMSLITGPSRTGDIERILVLGAHGPKKLTVLCF